MICFPCNGEIIKSIFGKAALYRSTEYTWRDDGARLSTKFLNTSTADTTIYAHLVMIGVVHFSSWISYWFHTISMRSSVSYFFKCWKFSLQCFNSRSALLYSSCLSFRFSSVKWRVYILL